MSPCCSLQAVEAGLQAGEAGGIRGGGCGGADGGARGDGGARDVEHTGGEGLLREPDGMVDGHLPHRRHIHQVE